MTFQVWKMKFLNSMTFQVWKMKFLNSMTFQVFHDPYEPYIIQSCLPMKPPLSLPVLKFKPSYFIVDYYNRLFFLLL